MYIVYAVPLYGLRLLSLNMFQSELPRVNTIGKSSYYTYKNKHWRATTPMESIMMRYFLRRVIFYKYKNTDWRKPCQCSHCSNAFLKSSKLIVHTGTHTGNKLINAVKATIPSQQIGQLFIHTRKSHWRETHINADSVTMSSQLRVVSLYIH